MLSHMGLQKEAEKINKAILKTIKEGKYLTRDLGGKTGTTEFTKAIIENLE